MQLRFSKMHGLGNDFMVVDMITQRGRLKPQQIQQLSDRNTGIGFDQLLLIETPSSPDVDFRYRIYNADGSEVENCGNGARCFARFVHNQRLTGKRDISVETNNGRMVLYMLDNNQVKVDMGRPLFTPAEIPFIAEQQDTHYKIEQDGQVYTMGTVSMGNPHGVLIVDDVEQAPVTQLGSKLTKHERFPQQANIGFMQIIDANTIKLRVFERGVGETKACGTGACAAVASGIAQGLLAADVKVHLRGGDLQIQWQGEDQSLYMTGTATHVYEGQIRL